MKNKALILVGLCAFGFCSWETQAINPKSTPIIINNMLNNMPNGFDEIDLLGDLLYNVGPTAIEAGASDDAVYIHFNQCFGNVSIAIYNSSGLPVYSCVVDTSVQQTIIISISNVLSGTYTVVLNNGNRYAEGDFER